MVEEGAFQAAAPDSSQREVCSQGEQRRGAGVLRVSRGEKQQHSCLSSVAGDKAVIWHLFVW